MGNYVLCVGLCEVRNQFFLSVTGTSGFKLRRPGLVVTSFAHQVISPFPNRPFLYLSGFSPHAFLLVFLGFFFFIFPFPGDFLYFLKSFQALRDHEENSANDSGFPSTLRFCLIVFIINDSASFSEGELEVA